VAAVTENIVEFTGDWYGEIDPADMIQKAAKWGADNVLVLAYVDGEVTAGSSMNEVGEILLLIEKFKHKLLSGGFETT
jgi:hypothetical protein